VRSFSLLAERIERETAELTSRTWRPLCLIVRFDYIRRRRAACEDCPREHYQHQGANPEARGRIGGLPAS
jgi:hypothetical protein